MRKLQVFQITQGDDTLPTWSYITISGVYVPTTRRERVAGWFRGLWYRSRGPAVVLYARRLVLALIGRDLYEPEEWQ